MSGLGETILDMTNSDTTRRLQHVLLDMLAAVDVDGQTELPEDWVTPFSSDMTRLGAVEHSIEVAGSNITVNLDCTPLVIAALGLLEIMTQDLVGRAETDRLTVIHAVREAADDADLSGLDED